MSTLLVYIYTTCTHSFSCWYWCRIVVGKKVLPDLFLFSYINVSECVISRFFFQGDIRIWWIWINLLETHKDIHCMLSHKALLLFTVHAYAWSVDYLSIGNYKDFHPLFYKYKNVNRIFNVVLICLLYYIDFIWWI